MKFSSQKILGCMFICCLLYACNSNQPAKDDASATFKGKWYKRFTGTIAGQQVVVNLFCYGGNQVEDGLSSVGGTYYYRNKSEIISLAYDFDKSKGSNAVFGEYVAEGSDKGGDDKHPEWNVTFTDQALTGKWHSADGKKTYDIDLHESYDNNSYPFDIVIGSDSFVNNGKKQRSVALFNYAYIVPAASMKPEDAQFIKDALLRELMNGTEHLRTFDEYAKTSAGQYFAEYRQYFAEDSSADDAGERNNWEADENSTCEYNDNGLVAFALSAYNYSGGAHGNYWTKIYNLDVQNKKVLHLGDVITVDSVKLDVMLQQEARKFFGLSPTDSLSGSLLVDTIPPTNNFVISGRGLTFCYNPYEIAAFAVGEVDLFLPYTQLSELLKPEFKKRMKL